ncbi:cupredoxin domain-containing protein [Arthrobacter sp. UYEF6]|uniref:cupredoxin domain-containing protein n=1 Tax=Pseudarthrobacter sp. S6 TaxID=3418420 RepID=UPI003398EAC0
MKENSSTRKFLGLAAAAASLLALAGCGTPGMSGSGTTAAPTVTERSASAVPTTQAPAPSNSSPGSSPAAAAAKILIKGFKYQGSETVSPGATISVVNEDVEAHTITADTGAAFDTTIQAGAGSFTAPAEPGTYPYHCIFHGNMKGTLTVK